MEQGSGWEISKKINLGHVIMTITLTCGLIFFFNDFDDRVDRLEFRADYQELSSSKRDDHIKELFEYIREDLADIKKRLNEAD